MTTPNKAEKAWMEKLEKLLTNPPSDRIGTYTTGDREIMVYERTKEDDLNDIMDRCNTDFCCAVDELDAGLGIVRAAMNIHSTSG